MVLEALSTVSKRGSVGWLHTISACRYWDTLLDLFYFYADSKNTASGDLAKLVAQWRMWGTSCTTFLRFPTPAQLEN
jgi:hypothetical protein